MEHPMEHSEQPSSASKWLAISGIVIHALGLIFLVVVVSRAMVEVNNAAFGQAGIGDPSVMRDAIEGMTKRFLVINFMMQGINAVGNFPLVLSLTTCRYRAVWFFWFICIWGALSIPSVPFGTAFGIFFLVYALSRKEEFIKAPQTSTSLS